MTTNRTVPDPGLTEREVNGLLTYLAASCAEADAIRKKLVAALPPVMEEPTYLGAVVMTDDGLAVRMYGRIIDSGPRWFSPWGEPVEWSKLPNPRPITDSAERAKYNLPRVLGDDEVAVLVAPGLIERVARAIHGADNRLPYRGWGSLDSNGVGVYKRMAKSAITATLKTEDENG